MGMGMGMGMGMHKAGRRSIGEMWYVFGVQHSGERGTCPWSSWLSQGLDPSALSTIPRQLQSNETYPKSKMTERETGFMSIDFCTLGMFIIGICTARPSQQHCSDGC